MPIHVQSRVNRVGNPGYKDTKSAFVDYAAAMEQNGSTRAAAWR